jgi:hypothetical protein
LAGTACYQKDPEIKVPKRCSGHVYLTYIVWESFVVIDQPAIVRFLTHKKLSTRDITAELEGEYGYEALSLSAVKK